MNAAKESTEVVEEAVLGVDVIFVTAGMAVGTGTNRALVIAGIAKRRVVQAQEGIAALRENVDTPIVIPNDKLLTAVSQSTPIPGLVNVGFADVRAIMADVGFSLMGIGTALVIDSNEDAVLNAIQSPLLDIGIERATGIVWNITGGSDLTLFEVNATAEVIYDLVDPGANLIFGAVIDPSVVK
ncbi:Cell division protein FtsZ [Ancistrocladus abbreviatus]